MQSNSSSLDQVYMLISEANYNMTVWRLQRIGALQYLQADLNKQESSLASTEVNVSYQAVAGMYDKQMKLPYCLTRS